MPTTTNSSPVNFLIEKFRKFRQLSYNIIIYAESFFYRLGYTIANHPKTTIAICWLVVALAALGLLRFRQEKDPMELWVPPDTKFKKDTNWLVSKFEKGYRTQAVLISGDNVLKPKKFQKLMKIHRKIESSTSGNGIKWRDVCFEIPKVDSSLLRYYHGNRDENYDASAQMNAGMYCSFVETMNIGCLVENLLELWDFNDELIEDVTEDEILYKINNYDHKLLLGRLRSYESLLGGVVRNSTGQIIAANALLSHWIVAVDFTDMDMEETGNMAGTSELVTVQVYDWENEFVKIMEAEIRENDENFTLDYISGRTFGDESSKAVFQDMRILSVGIFIMVIYIQLVLSKFNCLESRAALGSLGLLTVGMAFIVGVGICSLMGIPYGPIHTSLPFLLMGLGVDDMFVIMAAWNDLDVEQRKRPLPERVGLMLKHAGVSICVTAFTDVLAFIIGASTILPCLESYCIYAAFGVAATFIFAVTFFIACFVLDEYRLMNRCNGVIVCWQHLPDYEPNQCSQRNLSNVIFEWIYAKIVFTLPGKIIVIFLAVISVGYSIDGVMQLEQRFDPMWMVPSNGRFANFQLKRHLYYPNRGYDGGVYVGAVNYSLELPQLIRIRNELINMTDIINEDIIEWITPFRDYVWRNFKADIYTEILSEVQFNQYLSLFLFSPTHARFQANFRFVTPLECGAPAPQILISTFEFTFKYFTGPKQYIPAMHRVGNIIGNDNFTTGDRVAIVWSRAFATWITDELINHEVVRNLQLALLAVMICTIILIVDLRMCAWIFLCVTMTMINVCGWMQRWGLTIDLVSCIGLELAIGLCVDYATHVAHTFLTISGSSNTQRCIKTVKTIGAAVVYGGGSTIIGVMMLSFSEAYNFRAFFKIFLLTVTSGLFHGVIFLPVMLTWFGSKPYEQRTLISSDDNELDEKL